MIPLVTLGLVGASTGAQQSAPVNPPSDPKPASVPVQASPTPQTPVSVPAQASPTPQTPVSGSVQASSTPQTPAKPAQSQAPQTPAAIQDLNPAAQRYGLPRNPTLGGPVDTDLSKTLTLERAIRIGLARQDTIAIAQSQVEAANARVTQARSSYYPQVTPTFQYQTNVQPGVQFNQNTGTSSNGSFSSETRSELIAARLLLYDSGRREANVGLARRSAFGFEYGLANQRQSVVFVVSQAYYNLLRDRELVKEQQNNAERARITRDVIQAQADVGSAARSDVLQAEADFANARVQVFLAQANFGVDQAALKNAMGIVTAQPVALPDETAPAPSITADPIGLEPYVRQAYANRLDAKQQQEQINAQGYNVRLAQINAGLSVDAQITEGYAFDPNAGENRAFIVGLSYPLFDGGNTRAAVRESRAALEQDRRTLDALEQNIRFDVEQAYVNREQARQRIEAAQVAVQAAQQNYEVALEKQRNQLVNIPEVTLAENQLVIARVSLVQAIYDFYIADAQLKRATGVNDPVFLPRVPGARPPALQPR
jgi:outer membrane protein